MARLRNRHQEAFAREVAALTPYATAYALAGYGGEPQWHKFNASKLANKPHVRTRIAELNAKFEEAGCIHAQYIQAKLLPIIEANCRDMFDPVLDVTGNKVVGYTLRSLADMPRDLTSAISKIKCDAETGAVTEISLHSKVEAGNVLLRSVGGIVEKHQHDVGAIGARLAAALGRVGSDQRQIAAANPNPGSDLDGDVIDAEAVETAEDHLPACV